MRIVIWIGTWLEIDARPAYLLSQRKNLVMQCTASAMLISASMSATASFLLWPLYLSVHVCGMLDPMMATGAGALGRVGGSKRGDR